MRYDDSPERDNIPMIHYVVTGRPNIEVMLHEEVEPVGEIFNAIIVMDSSMLTHPTSQRALMFDGAKKDVVLVVNTSLTPGEVIGLVKKYSLAQDWYGKLVTMRARSYDGEIAYPLLAALIRAWEIVSLDDLLASLDTVGKGHKASVVKRAYEATQPLDVRISSEETTVAKVREKKSKLLENLPTPKIGEHWDLETYRRYQRAAAEAVSYSDRLHAMPGWEALAPGLIEFGPSPGDKNIGFKTSFSRHLRPIIDKAKCIDCKMCHLYCPDGAIDFHKIEVDLDYCQGCGICSMVCPVKIIKMVGELEAKEGLTEEEIVSIEKALREYGF